MLPYIDTPFIYVAGKLGASSDELKLIVSFLLSYPLAALLKRIPDSKPWQKNVFIIAVSIFYLVGLFDLWSGLATIFISAAGTYAIAAFIQGPYMPWVGFTFLMGYMSISHIYRQIVSDPGLVDITGAQMVLVMKLSAFCWNVYDGQQAESTLNDYQKERGLKNLPGMLEYAAFVLFFPSLFAGPAFDFIDYRRWIETSMFELPAGTDPSKAPPTRKQRKIPRSGTPAAWKAAIGLAWILAFLKFSGWYNTEFMLSKGYGQISFIRRIWLMYMLGLTTRMKYYGVWSLTEGSCILSGIGYKGVDPKTGRADWSRLENVRPMGVELAQNSHAYLGNWNINTNLWLRNYVYLRVTPRGQKPGFRATLATFITSAFWHGFYPGYYLSFVLAAFLQNISKNSRRLLRPFFMSADGKQPLPTKRYYDFFSWVVTQLSFSFTTAPFVLLSIHDSLLVWARVYFYTIVGTIACSVFLLTPGKQWLTTKVKAKNRPAMARADSHDELSTLGLPNDPGQAWDEMVEEINNEIDARRRKGIPITGELRKAGLRLGKDL